MSDYFKELAKKIEVDVPHHVDKKIMDSLPMEENEGFLKLGFSMALAASLAFIVYMNFGPNQLSRNSETYAISEMIENKEMYEQMDLLGQVEDVELSDEEWNVLLGEEEGDV